MYIDLVIHLPTENDGLVTEKRLAHYKARHVHAEVPLSDINPLVSGLADQTTAYVQTFK